MAVFRFVKFQVCLKSVNISFEPEFGNPRFETPTKWCFQFSVNLFLSNCWFYFIFGSLQASAEKPGVLNFFFMLSSKREFSKFKPSISNPAFQTQRFKTRVLTQPDFENPKKNHFKPEKGHFWFTLKGSFIISIREYLIYVVETFIFNLTHFRSLKQKSNYNFAHFWLIWTQKKIVSEIYWPLRWSCTTFSSVGPCSHFLWLAM